MYILISSIVCKLLAGSKFANGSSNNNIGAFVVNKPAKETVCFALQIIHADFVYEKYASLPFNDSETIFFISS